MTLPASPQVALVASLAKLAALPLPPAGGPAPTSGVGASGGDTVSLADTPPGATTFWSMASEGLRQLTALLPALERLIGPSAATPIGHVARAMADAAHQVGTGYGGLLDGTGAPSGLPSPDTLEGWRGNARGALADAAVLLARAEQTIGLPDQAAQNPVAPNQPPPNLGPETLWAIAELMSAQRQVGAALGTLSAGSGPSSPAPPPPPGRLAPLLERVGTIALLLVAVAGSAICFGTAGFFASLLGGAGWCAWSARAALPRPTLRLALNR